jgi:hypothetical protein
MNSLERTLAALPPELRQEVQDFAEFLLAKRAFVSPATGEKHPLAPLAGAWTDEPLSDDELLPERTLGREVKL